MSSASEKATATVVPLLDLGAQYATIESEIRAAIDDVCQSQWFILGPKVSELEARIADYSGAAFGIGVSSGTDALLLALMALEIGPGDAVITTTYSFFATGGVVSRLGARPIFCDIEPDACNLSTDSVRDFIKTHCRMDGDQLIHVDSGDRVKVLMPVHLYGQVADMQGLCAIANEYGLRVVEDAAQAIGAEDAQGRRAGSIGDIGCFSFFPSKNLGAFGDAGMCVTQDEALAERMRVLRVHGGKPKYFHALVGGNFRLDAIQAAILLVKLQYLDGWTKSRQHNAQVYYAALADLATSTGVRALTAPTAGRHIYNQFVVRSDRRDALQAHLKANNIGCEIYYPVPLHLQACFADLGYQQGDCPEAEKAAAETIAIPIYPELTDTQKEAIIDCVRSFAQ